MPSATVRISENSRNILRALAAQEGESMQAIVEKSIEQYRRQRFLEAVNAAYEALRQDNSTWKEMENERNQWEVTLSDGLPKDEVWTADGQAVSIDNRKQGA